MAVTSSMPGGSWGVGGIETGWGMTDFIPAWRLMLAPDSKDVKLETDADKDMSTLVEAVPLQKLVDPYHKGVSCRFFLVPPEMADTPSAYWAVHPVENPKDTPNMMFVDVVVQSTAGLTFADGLPRQLAESLAPLAAVVERDDTLMGFTIKVLVNCVDLKKGDLLTRPSVEKAKKVKDERRAVTTQEVLKRARTSR